MENDSKNGCPSCGENSWRPSYVFGDFQVYVCGKCGLGCLRGPLPGPEELYGMNYYANEDPEHGYDDYAALLPALERSASSRMKRIERYLPERGRLLDVGCGLGAALRVALRRGWRAEGMEVTEDVVARLHADNLEARRGSAESLSAREEFDCVTMWDTLEHVGDAVGAVAATARALRPGGVFAFTTCDRESICARLSGRAWHLYYIPEHRFFFTERSLRIILSRAGLECLSLRRRGSWYSLEYICERLRRNYKVPVRLSGIIGGMSVYANLFDVIEVIARKPGG